MEVVAQVVFHQEEVVEEDHLVQEEVVEDLGEVVVEAVVLIQVGEEVEVEELVHLEEEAEMVEV